MTLREAQDFLDRTIQDALEQSAFVDDVQLGENGEFVVSMSTEEGEEVLGFFTTELG